MISPTNEVESPSNPPPPPETPDQQSAEQLVLTDIDAIHQLLVKDAEESPAASLQRPDQLNRIGNVAFLVAFVSLALFFIEVLGLWLRVGLALVMLVATVVSASALAISIWRDWQRRRVETMQDLSAIALQERDLIQRLLLFSRAALLHVAATARARDQVIGQRIILLLGPNRAGGILGALFLTLGVFSAGKYLQENKTVLPLLGNEITSTHVLGVGMFLFAFTVMLLFAGARVSRLNPTAELLERVAALKKHLAEEAASQDKP